MDSNGVFKLATGMHESPGLYALLIGSGLSSAAGIPTGWQVTIDLIRRIAKREKEDPKGDLEAWFIQKFGKPPSYSDLLSSITSSSSERAALLRSYFEPTDDERVAGKKVPTQAHKMIAKLARDGLVRMILTTNFDRLLEQALDAEGVSADVISTDDALKGALPYVHSNCTLVKLNGDYRDTRLKNTEAELSEYSGELMAFLGRVFDDFGLIVCGWSGEWDIALRNSIMRAPNRRFATYWFSRGAITETARRVAELRKAVVIQISNADQAFQALHEYVESLKELDMPDALSTQAAIATIKRYIPDPMHRIRLHDLLQKEQEIVYERLRGVVFVPQGAGLTKETYQSAVRWCDAIVERLAGMVTALAYHSDSTHDSQLITNCLERLAREPQFQSYVPLDKLQQYPALRVMYASGIASLAARRYRNLAAAIRSPIYRDRITGERRPLISSVNIWEIFPVAHSIDKLVPVPNAEVDPSPAHTYLRNTIREMIREYVPDETKYAELFDIFEFLLVLNRVWFDQKSGSKTPNKVFLYLYQAWWNPQNGNPASSQVVQDFLLEGAPAGKDWALLRAGFFDRSTAEYAKAIRVVNEREEQSKSW